MRHSDSNYPTRPAFIHNAVTFSLIIADKQPLHICQDEGHGNLSYFYSKRGNLLTGDRPPLLNRHNGHGNYANYNYKHD